MQRSRMLSSFFMGCLVFSSVAFAESTTLTTYYPAPAGAYNNIRSGYMCIGAGCTTSGSNTLEVKNAAGNANVLAVNATTATISAPTTIQSTLSVTGGTTLTGAATFGSTLNVTGSTMLSSANISGTLKVADTGEFVLPTRTTASVTTGSIWVQ